MPVKGLSSMDLAMVMHDYIYKFKLCSRRLS